MKYVIDVFKCIIVGWGVTLCDFLDFKLLYIWSLGKEKQKAKITKSIKKQKKKPSKTTKKFVFMKTDHAVFIVSSKY